MKEKNNRDTNSPRSNSPAAPDRRKFIKMIAMAAPAIAMGGCGSKEQRDLFFQKHFKELSGEELKETLTKLEADYKKRLDADISISTDKEYKGTHFAYGLDVSRCIGCRRCVYGCVEENNLSRSPQVHWIQVLEMEKDKGVDFLHSNLYYDRETVPEKDHFYLPVACQQCKNPPCVKSCPVKATWTEPDGIVVIDYNWCIGCRCCMSSCPYGARHFNWGPPTIPKNEIKTKTHYLGNRPNYAGVVGKCTFCIQRVRQGRYPKCVEVCPVGARKFGNLLDKDSEIRYILENKRVMILKEELNTRPKFYYFFAT